MKSLFARADNSCRSFIFWHGIANVDDNWINGIENEKNIIDSASHDKVISNVVAGMTTIFFHVYKSINEILHFAFQIEFLAQKLLSLPKAIKKKNQTRLRVKLTDARYFPRNWYAPKSPKIMKIIWRKLARMGANIYPKKSNICRSMMVSWNEIKWKRKLC